MGNQAAALARTESDTVVANIHRLPARKQDAVSEETELGGHELIYPDLDDQITALRNEQDELFKRMGIDRDLIDRLAVSRNQHHQRLVRIERQQGRQAETARAQHGNIATLIKRTVNQGRAISGLDRRAASLEGRMQTAETLSTCDHAETEALKARVASIELAQARIGMITGIALMVGGSTTFLYLALSFLHLI